MAIRTPKRTGKIVINLDGPDGNHFVLMGYAKRWARDLGLDFEQIKAEIKAGGKYNTTVKILNEHFGDYVDFETTNKELLESA